MKTLLLLASFSFAGCINLNLDPVTIDGIGMKLLFRHTDPNKPKKDLPLTMETILSISGYTCFSQDDLAEIERKLNQCK